MLDRWVLLCQSRSTSFCFGYTDQRDSANKETILFSIFQASHPTDSKPSNKWPICMKLTSTSFVLRWCSSSLLGGRGLLYISTKGRTTIRLQCRYNRTVCNHNPSTTCFRSQMPNSACRVSQAWAVSRYTNVEATTQHM